MTATPAADCAAPAAHARWLIRRDLPAVLAIEAASFAEPWTEADFLRCLRQRNCIGMVAEVGNYPREAVVGFMIYELRKSSLRVLNFAVAPAHRRRGVGATLARKLKHKLAAHRRERITLVASEDNLAAHLFFRGQGFEAAKVLRGHYAEAGRDGYLFEYEAEGENQWT